MKKGLGFVIFLFFVFVVDSFANGGNGGEQESISIGLISLEIRHSMEEDERQRELYEEHLYNTGIETTNRNWWKKLREKTKKMQERLRFVDFALQAIPVGVVIVQKGEQIFEVQEKIIEEIQNAPYTIQQVIPQQIQFVNDFQMVLRFMFGLVVSYGSLNQMEKAERKILLDHAVNEINQILRNSGYTLRTIRSLKRKYEYQQFVLNHYIKKDKALINSIINNFKAL
ncbi:MAG: hypothetical protein Q4B43_07635 [Bacteroidota bacterium]|nr:hypothetical protein [Bacteroidota bacterium]